MNTILKQVFPWQTPVITEKQSFDCLSSNPITEDINYLAVPWAPFIDNYNFGNPKNKQIAEEFTKELKHVNFKDKDTFTICQSYRYREIIPLLKRMKVNTVFTSHAVDNETECNGVKIKPLPLYAVNTPPVYKKDIWYSFVGAYIKSYISDIRLKILEDVHPRSNTVIIKRSKWRFNDNVYEQQLKGIKTNPVQEYIGEEQTLFYNDILSRSRFSLCPSGAGPASIRFFESLATGSIPVVLADHWALPEINGFNWNDCSIRIEESEYKNLRHILSSISEEKELFLRNNCIKAYNNISGDNFVKCVRDYYERK